MTIPIGAGSKSREAPNHLIKMNTSNISILNVGAGDTKITFDPSNPQDVIRATRIIKDMLRRGYALLVQSGTDDNGNPTFTRALEFDERTAEYIIADSDPLISQSTAQAPTETTNQTPNTNEQSQPTPSEAAPPPPVEAPAVHRVPRRSQKRISGAGANVIAVAQTAGG